MTAPASKLEDATEFNAETLDASRAVPPTFKLVV